MTVRCFAALPIPGGVRESLERVLGPVRDLGWPVRWVRPEGVHITLKFFGEVARERVETIAESLDFAAQGIGPLAITLAGFGAFPAEDRARVLWAGVEAPAGLELLQDRVESRAEALGFSAEGAVYRPHVTIGRVREGERIARSEGTKLFGAAFSHAFTAEEVVLFQSVPGHGGAVYTPLHQAALRG